MTKNILHLDSSARYEDSISRALSAEVVKHLDANNVVYRDLAKGTNLIDQDWVFANFTPAEDRSDAQNKRLATSDELIAELETADTIVIGVATYNFQVPASVKLWIDQICRAGHTFQYTENGPVGLLHGKKAVVIMTSGGVPAGSPVDFVSPYMKHILSFIGIHDVEFINADRTIERAETVISEEKANIAALS